MKKFLKGKRLLSLIMAIVMLIIGAVSVYATSIEELEERQRELEEQNEQYQQQLDESREKVDEQQDYVDALIGRVQVLNEEISVIRQKIAALNEDIQEKQLQIDEKQRQYDEKNDKIKESIEILGKRLKAIYMAGDVSTLEIVLGAKSFSDFLDKVQLIQYVSKHDEELINKIQAQKDAIAGEKAALQASKEELLAEKAEQEEEQRKLEVKQEELNELLEENKEILANLQEASSEAEMRLELSEEELSQLSDEIRELKEEEERRRQEEEERRRQEEERRRQQEEQGGSGDDYPSYSSSTPDIPADGSWVWPTPGFYYLSSVFHEARSYEYHGGVDIAGADIMNTPIFAAHSGTVISTCYSCEHNWAKYYSCGCGGGYGNYVWIAHGDGKETIYGHMTTPVVNTGDYVVAGQLIGYVGTTGHSTGPHLHFEARYYGERYDPMSEY